MTLQQEPRGEPTVPAGEETRQAGRRRREGAECPGKDLALQARVHLHPPLCGDLLRESGEAGGRRVRRGVPQSAHEALLGDGLREAELHRRARIRARAQALLEKARTPFQVRRGKEEGVLRVASRNWERRLGFLRGDFSFCPRISSVPDFEGLQRAFQREASRREVREPTPSKPFRLRTCGRPCRHPQAPRQAPAQRSGSCTCLSPNTLPIHISDAARRRAAAIRLSQDDKTHKDNEELHWAETQRKRSQAMQRAVNSRAKALDPHQSLEEAMEEKLKLHRQNNQRKTKEYEKELEEMKRRVQHRPYLFEEATKHRASREALRLFRNTLQQFGLNEEFVRRKGEVQKEPPEAQSL